MFSIFDFSFFIFQLALLSGACLTGKKVPRGLQDSTSRFPQGKTRERRSTLRKILDLEEDMRMAKALMIRCIPRDSWGRAEK
jgi:hypothetical protein